MTFVFMRCERKNRKSRIEKGKDLKEHLVVVLTMKSL